MVSSGTCQILLHSSFLANTLQHGVFRESLGLLLLEGWALVRDTGDRESKSLAGQFAAPRVDFVAVHGDKICSRSSGTILFSAKPLSVVLCETIAWKVLHWNSKYYGVILV